VGKRVSSQDRGNADSGRGPPSHTGGKEKRKTGAWLELFSGKNSDWSRKNKVLIKKTIGNQGKYKKKLKKKRETEKKKTFERGPNLEGKKPDVGTN